MEDGEGVLTGRRIRGSKPCSPTDGLSLQSLRPTLVHLPSLLYMKWKKLRCNLKRL